MKISVSYTHLDVYKRQESNLNAFLFHKGNIYIATSKGVVIENSRDFNNTSSKPFMAIEQVTIDKDVKTNFQTVNGYTLPKKLQLNHLQNNISF